MDPANAWDAERYQARHRYVWEHGDELIDLLDPQPGIVDLGCGSGQLTDRIAQRGAAVIGIDSAPAMIAQARINFPHLTFRLAEAVAFEVEGPADAVFSNAVLHWVKDAGAAAGAVWRALRAGGRFVAEFGGAGNVRSVLEALEESLGPAASPWYYPTVGEYAGLLEGCGFEVAYAALFDRPTRVEGEDGLEDWLEMFASSFFAGRDERERRAIAGDIAGRLRPRLYRDGAWFIDYRRLRVVARKGA